MYVNKHPRRIIASYISFKKNRFIEVTKLNVYFYSSHDYKSQHYFETAS